ncbi:hypothetical protein [Xinfangfangia pollutisoli]|uniref:hypothetical protein n=1 Tax=Xinfangfangia pollutisoli TaxID=2865960 RepID=UPI001CD4FEA1|nr:hypothetical protein [Xinfangfangia pollutisoli]
MKKTLIALAATTILAGAAFAEGLPTVKEIDVTADIASVSNSKAAEYWKNLEGDLENAILAKLVDQTDKEDGAKVIIDISEVELADGFTDTMGLEKSVLKGIVNETHDRDNSRFNSYELTVSYDQAAPMLGEGFNPNASAEDARRAYEVMVDVFADHVVKNLK